MVNPEHDFHEQSFRRRLHSATPSEQKRSLGGGDGPPPPKRFGFLAEVARALAFPLTVAGLAYGAVGVSNAFFSLGRPADGGNGIVLREEIEKLSAKIDKLNRGQIQVVLKRPIRGFVQDVDPDDHKFTIAASGLRVVAASYDPNAIDLRRGDFVEVMPPNSNEGFPEFTTRLHRAASRTHNAPTVNRATNQVRVP
jgi:hypothetical protein